LQKSEFQNAQSFLFGDGNFIQKSETGKQLIANDQPHVAIGMPGGLNYSSKIYGILPFWPTTGGIAEACLSFEVGCQQGPIKCHQSRRQSSTILYVVRQRGFDQGFL
jgi:hypothetical protein